MNPIGFPEVSFETLCAYHPGFALAILKGVSVRPSMRIVQATFSSPALNTPVSGAFDQIVTAYSVFVGCDVSIDPTSAFPGNPLKTTSDFFLASGASGIQAKLLAATSGDNNYSPILSFTPLQMIPGILSKAAGKWRLQNPDNIRADFLLSAAPQAVPLTVWLSLSFLVLGPLGQNFTNLPPDEARRQLMAEMRALGMIGGGSAQPSTP